MPLPIHGQMDTTVATTPTGYRCGWCGREWATIIRARRCHPMPQGGNVDMLTTAVETMQAWVTQVEADATTRVTRAELTAAITAAIAGKASTADIAQLQASIITLQNAITQLQARTTTLQAVSATMPLLALGGTWNQTLSWPIPWPPGTYSTAPLPGSGLLGRGDVTITAQTTNTVSVRVTAGLAISAGAALTVIGARTT